MLSKKYRLSKNADIKRVFVRGRAVQDRGLRMKYLLRSSGGPRFAFVVSNKVLKRAVKRNRLKRQLRALAARVIKNIEKPYDFVISATPYIVNTPFQKLQEMFKNLLYRAKILQNTREKHTKDS